MQNQVSLSRLFTGRKALHDCSEHSDFLRVTPKPKKLSNANGMMAKQTAKELNEREENAPRGKASQAHAATNTAPDRRERSSNRNHCVYTSAEAFHGRELVRAV